MIIILKEMDDFFIANRFKYGTFQELEIKLATLYIAEWIDVNRFPLLVKKDEIFLMII